MAFGTAEDRHDGRTAYDDPVRNAALCTVVLPRGTVVKVNGFPVALETDCFVRVAPANVSLLFEPQPVETPG